MTKRLAIISGAVTLAVAGGAWWYASRTTGPTYRTAKVDRGAVESAISATGNSNAVVTVQVGSQVSGNVQALYANFNSHVKKGDVVARIDPAPFQARVDQAQGSLLAAQATLATYRGQLEKAAADIASAQANFKAAQAGAVKANSALLDARTKYQRRVELFKAGVISAEDRDSARNTADTAQAELEAAQSQVAAAQQAITSAEAQRRIINEQLNGSQGQLKSAQASLQQAEIDLAHTTIHAPVDGTVISRQVDVGQTVAASMQAPTLFSIAEDLAKMQVDTNVDEADIGRVQVGLPATFTVDAYPGRSFQGMVSEIRKAPIVTQNVVTYDVVVAVPNPDLKLLPGMTANVRVVSERRDNVLRVPNAALRFRPTTDNTAQNAVVHAASRKNSNEQKVWVRTRDGKIESRMVIAGISDGSYTAINGGNLREGDEVIVSASSGTSQAKSKQGSTAASGGMRPGGPGL